MISAIKISDDFIEIYKEYKKFKHIIYKKWCGTNEISYQIEEAKLISEIKSIIEKITNYPLRKNKSTDDDLMRALIASKTLSNYTILNQDQCVNFFIKIEENLPNSIQKRQFFFKCVAKEINNKSHFLWDDFVYNVHKKILPMNSNDSKSNDPKSNDSKSNDSKSNDSKSNDSKSNDSKSNDSKSIVDILIYINFLIQIAPDFVCQSSTEIFHNLFTIIETEKYKLDLNYNILSLTNETTDTYFDNNDNEKYFSNYAIETLRLLFTRINLIRYQTIEINNILEWEPIKALATLLILFEKCTESFLKNQIEKIYDFLLNVDKNNSEVICLLIRNLIFCSLIKKDTNIDIIKTLFSFDGETSNNLICGKIQNLKLLIDKNHPILDDISFDKQKVINIIFNYLDSDKYILKQNAFDLLNSCILYDIEQKEGFFEFDSKLITKLFKQGIIFDYTHVIKFMVKNNEQLFMNNLNHSLNSKTLETLQFINNRIKYEETNQDELIFNDLSNDNKDQIGRNAFTLFNNNSNPDIKAIAPFIVAKLSPSLLFSSANIKELFKLLLTNKNENVKLSILKCFNDHLNSDNFYNYPELETELNQLKTKTLFKILLNDYSPRKVQIETIKFICKLIQFGLDFKEIIDPYLNYFLSFSKEKIESSVALTNYSISTSKLAMISEFLPFIFESYPSCYNQYFQSFYNFALDYMNYGANSNINYSKHIELQTKVVQKTFFQRKFFKITFRSFIDSLRIIHRKNPTVFQRNYREIINFCSINIKNKMDELETQYILSFLEQIFAYLGIDWIYSSYQSKDINELFTAILETGSRFASPEIHQLIFRILGFLGAQLPLTKEQPKYKDYIDKKNKLANLLQEKLFDYYSNVNNQNYFFRNVKKHTIFYAVCFNSVLNILEDETMSQIHILALESLIKITKSKKNSDSENNYKICFNYFKELLKKSIGQDKKKFIHLFELMLDTNRNVITPYVIEFSQIFVDLWEYGSISILKSLTKSFGNLLVPCLDIIVRLIQSLDDINLVIDNLVIILNDCFTMPSYNYFDIDIINILIQMGNDGYYQTFSPLSKAVSVKMCGSAYYASMIQMCLKYVNNLPHLSIDDRRYFDDAVELICTVIITIKRESSSDFLSSFDTIIESAFQQYPDQLNKINDAIEGNNNRSKNQSSFDVINTGNISKDCSDYLYDEPKRKFIEIITNINSNIENEVDSLYIEQWLNKLILFSIKASPNEMIKYTYSIAKNNKVFACSIFKYAFLSFFDFLKKNKPISNTILAVLKYKNTPDHCKAILIDLIEFMDRYSLPLFSSKDFNYPLNLIFSSKPPVNLYFAARGFEEQIDNAATDLQYAFLNVGLIDDCKQFSKLYNISTYNKKKYQLPIFASSSDEIHNIEIANNLFNEKIWDKFEFQADQFHQKSILHLFKAAEEIQRFLQSNPDFSFNGQTRIENALKEINLGFDSLGNEGGPYFTQGFTSIIQSIIYGQQLTELKEISLSISNKFHYRFSNSDEILSFLPPILLLRIAAKNNYQDSLAEKLELLSLCRKSNRWETMQMYKEFFNFNENVPIEIQYEMMYYKMANNLATEEEFDSLINSLDNKLKEGNNSYQLGDEYKYQNLINLLKYQKAVYISHSPEKDLKWKDVISLCENFDNSDAINLLGWSNLKLFELTKDQTFLNQSIKHYVDAVIKSEKSRISNLLLIIYLLFTHYNNSEFDVIDKILKKIPLHFYLEVMSQFISYIPNLKEDNSFKNFIMNLLTKLMVTYPKGVIYNYSFSLYCDNININGVVVNSPIKEIKDKLNDPHFNEAQKLTNFFLKVSIDYNNSFREFIQEMYMTIRKNRNLGKNEFRLAIKRFYPKYICFMKDFFERISNYYEKLPNAYEPNLLEQTTIERFKSTFYKAKKIFSSWENDLNDFINEDSPCDFSNISSKLHEIYNNLNKSNKTSDHFSKISSEFANMNNFILPIFGVYRYNEKAVCIHKITDKFEIKKTLKSPMKIEIYGDDGHIYSYLLKQSEDLRSDERVMIFHKFLNRIIKTKIRTFAIVPLTPNLGIIQYVNNTKELATMIRLYKNKLVMDDQIRIPSFEGDSDEYGRLSKIKRLEYFENKITKYKDRVNDLKNSFWLFAPNSEAWLKIVKNYTETCATTSIVGYIMGLGDRHLNNILIDVKNGTLIHIDFNDLFEVNQKRKTINKEMVPFRLTNNLIAAFGPCGYNGTFTLKCEEVLATIRENREIVINVLNVFVDSPIHSQNRTFVNMTRNFSEIEAEKEDAKISMKRIIKKVNGTDINIVYPLDDDLQGLKNIEPISVHDHVQKLIKCATNHYYLASGFFGWEPWC